MRYLRILLFCTLAGCAGVDTRQAPVTTVAGLQLDRYLGKWYEIGSYPNRFQKGCVATSARYTRIDPGTIRVVNECRQDRLDGDLRRIEGKAWIAGDGTDPSRLKLRFFWPFAGDYWVIALDPEYRWAVVGHPKRRYLWILAREPRIPDSLYSSLLERAAEQGFDVSRVKRTPQPEA